MIAISAILWWNPVSSPVVSVSTTAYPKLVKPEPFSVHESRAQEVVGVDSALPRTWCAAWTFTRSDQTTLGPAEVAGPSVVSERSQALLRLNSLLPSHTTGS
jgi:hypothetical protein